MWKNPTYLVSGAVSEKPPCTPVCVTKKSHKIFIELNKYLTIKSKPISPWCHYQLSIIKESSAAICYVFLRSTHSVGAKRSWSNLCGYSDRTTKHTEPLPHPKVVQQVLSQGFRESLHAPLNHLLASFCFFTQLH